MISLPPGCSVNYPIYIEIKEMTTAIIDWYRLIGGIVTIDETYDYRGRKREREFVQYGKGKKCYYRADGSGGIRLHFAGEDAAVADMFIIKFLDVVETHNLKEATERALFNKY